MGIEVEEKAVGLDNQEVGNISDIDIDSLVDDCVNVEQGCFLGGVNFEIFTQKLHGKINEESQKLVNKIFEIVNNRVSQGVSAYKSQCDSQILQRKAELNAQLNQEMQAKAQSINQSMSVYSILNGQAEFNAFQASRSAEINNIFASYQSAVVQNYNDKINQLNNTAQRVYEQKE